MKHSIFSEILSKTAAGLVMITVSMYLGTTLPRTEQPQSESVQAQTKTENEITIPSKKLKREPITEIKTYSVPLTTEAQLHLMRTAQDKGIRPELVLSIITIESNFDPNAVSHTDDHGLMQINRINHEQLKAELGIDNFYDPEQNITAGIHILDKCLKHFNGDETHALIAYQHGIRGAEMLLDQGYRETTYSQKVQAREAMGFDATIRFVYGEVQK